jgi:MFS transporter, ACS family, tartrate transporter
LTSSPLSPGVYGWSFVYSCSLPGLYGLGFWIPTVLPSRGIDLRTLGWATALPYLVAIVAMLLWSASSDHYRERRWHLVAAYLASMPIFWSASTIELASPLVAARIAIINSIGNLGGFFGPALIGWLSHTTHSYLAGLATIAVCLAIGAIGAARLARHPVRRPA